jgi:hypothetical protein
LSVEQTTCFDECMGAYVHNTMFWVIGIVGAAFTAGGWVSRVSGAVCVPDGALDVVPEVVAAGNIGGGSCDMVTVMGRSGHGGRG